MKKINFLHIFTVFLIIFSSTSIFYSLRSEIDEKTIENNTFFKTSFLTKIRDFYPSFFPNLNLKRFVTEHPVLWFSDNFYEVEKEKLYRSKTLSPESLEKYIIAHDIKSILILRDPEPQAEWYIQEMNIAKKHNVTVHCIPLKKTNLPTKEEIEKILRTFEHTKQPLLIHCQAGADRTGMIAALWVLHKMNGSLHEALSQLQQKYAHVEWFKPSMKQFITIWHSLKNRTQDPLLHYNHDEYPHFISIEERVASLALVFKLPFQKLGLLKN